MRRDEPSFYLEGSTQEDLTLPVRADKSSSPEAMPRLIEAFEQGLDMRMWVHYRDGFGAHKTTYSVFARDDEGNYHVSEPPVRVIYPPPWKRAVYSTALEASGCGAHPRGCAKAGSDEEVGRPKGPIQARRPASRP